jgi:hypothetical protein
MIGFPEFNNALWTLVWLDSLARTFLTVGFLVDEGDDLRFESYWTVIGWNVRSWELMI